MSANTTLSHYRIVEKLGAGGMGEVWLAEDTRLGREVAIKVLPAELTTDAERVRRFMQEARAASSLNHPNIITVYDIGEGESGHFIVMELVSGRTLRTVISEDLSLESILAIGQQSAKALAAASAAGITHRDIKPENIMVRHDGYVKVLDFGLARLWSAHQTKSDFETATMTLQTNPGELMGTVAYMSPEQARGEAVSYPSDVFALGIVLYELATGRHPFKADSLVGYLHAITLRAPLPLTSLKPEVPPVLEALILRMLEKDAGKRPTAGEIVQTLQEIERSGSFSLRTTPGTSAVLTPPETLAAFDRHEWETAYRSLHELSSSRPLSAEELEMLASSALWLSRFDECIETRERAFAAYMSAGQKSGAARMALDLCTGHNYKNARIVAQGWLKRAERIIAEEPNCVERGYLIRRQALAALGRGDLQLAQDLNRQAHEIGERFHDSDLQTMSSHLEGRILIAQGDTSAGMSLVDEAMAGAVAGEVKPFTLGDLLCNTMQLCESLGDFHRAREWNEAAMTWCELDVASPWPSVCRVHSAKTMRNQGRWEEAERAARSACDALQRCGHDMGAGDAFKELGDLELRKGNHVAAEAAYQKAHEIGVDPVPGLPLLRLAQGNREAAEKMLDRALGECTGSPLHRAELLVARLEVDLAGNRFAEAESAAKDLMEIADSYDSAMYRAYSLKGRGAVALALDNIAEAATLLRESWSLFRETGFPYEAAQARMLLGDVYLKNGNNDDARMQFESARKTFGDLGAMPDHDAVQLRLKALG
ncbi:MAG: protein kinase [Blastocatellales bacterium]